MPSFVEDVVADGGNICGCCAALKCIFFRMPKNALMNLELFYGIALKRD